MGVTALQRERWSPWVAGLSYALLAEVLLSQSFIVAPKEREEYLAALLSVGGIFAGFMATLNAMLFAMNERTRKRLHNSGYEADLRTYVAEAVYGAFVICACSLAAFFMESSNEVNAVLIGIAVFTLAAVIRVSVIGTRLLSLR